MTPVAQNPMMALYGRLRILGLAQPYLQKNILPSWWDDEIAVTPAGRLEAVTMLARRAGIDLLSLRDSSATPRLLDVACKFKAIGRADESELCLARNLSVQVAKLAASAMTTELRRPESAAAIRQQLLSQGHQWINLEVLVDYCWSIGIPVLYVSEFPRGIPIMDGLAAIINDRPVIVISSRRKHSAWLLFDLAHELGHITLGHVAPNQILVDDDLEQRSDDSEEVEANEFALTMLSGSSAPRVRATDRWLNAAQLACFAQRMGIEHQIDPGHIVLVYAHCMGSRFWAVVNAALKLIEPHAKGNETLRQRMIDNLDWSELSNEDNEFIMNMTGAQAAHLS